MNNGLQLAVQGFIKICIFQIGCLGSTEALISLHFNSALLEWSDIKWKHPYTAPPESWLEKTRRLWQINRTMFICNKTTQYLNFGKLLKWNFMKHLLAFENIEKKFLAHLRNFPRISRCHRMNSNVDVLPQASSFLTRRIIQGSSLIIWVSYTMIKLWNGNWLNIYFQ